jgi:hypothetical protein
MVNFSGKYLKEEDRCRWPKELLPTTSGGMSLIISGHLKRSHEVSLTAFITHG